MRLHTAVPALLLGTMFIMTQHHIGRFSENPPNSNSTHQASKELTELTVPNLGSGMILLRSLQSLWIVDPDNLQRRFFLDMFPDPGQQIGGIVISPEGQYIYVTQTPSNSAPKPADEVKITQIDPVTRVRRTILQKAGVTGFDLSPDGHLGIVWHLPNPEQPDHGFPVTFCILHIATGTCSASGLSFSFATWLDGNRLVALSDSKSAILLVNASTLEAQKLDKIDKWAISRIAVIPKQNKLVLAGRSLTTNRTEFVTFELATAALSVLPYSINRDYYAVIEDFQLSRDSTYMMYGRSGHHVLVNFETGAFVAEFDNMAFPQWTADSKSIIAVMFNNSQYELTRFDSVSGKVVTSTILTGGATLLAVP